MTQFTFPNIMSAVLVQPETFVGGRSKEQILAFMAGLELNMLQKDRFSVNVGQLITSQYKINADQRGWVGQIEDFSRKKGFEWISGFKQLGIELVLNEMNAHERDQYSQFLKHFIVKLIEELTPENPQFTSAWIDQWLGIVLLHTAWGRDLWTSKQLDILQQIDEEIKKVNVLHYHTPGISVDLDILRYQFMEVSAVVKTAEK